MSTTMNLSQRLEKWVNGSFAVGGPDQRRTFLTFTIQALGHLDCQLIQQEAFCWSAVPPAMDLTNHLTLSYLWVLGSYEWLRTLDQAVCGNQFPEFSGTLADQIKGTKNEFARLRMPLAKLEESNVSKSGKLNDGPIAYPGRHDMHGVAWVLSDTYTVTRLALSESALRLLADLRAARKT